MKIDKLYVVAFAAFAFLLSTQLVKPVMPELTSVTGASTSQAASILSSALVALVLFQFFSGPLADRYGKRRMVLLGVILGAITSLGILFIKRWQTFLALRIISGIADAITMPALLGLTAELGKDRESWAFGLFRGSQGIAFVIGPTIGGFIAYATWLRFPFLVDAIITILAGMMIVTMVKALPASEHHAGLLSGIKNFFTSFRFYVYALFGIANTFAVPVVWAFLPLKAQHFGHNEVDIAYLLTAEAITFTMTNFLVGKVSQRLGKRRIIFVSQLIIIASLLLMAFQGTYLWWVMSMLLFGIGSACTYLLATVYAAEAIGEQGVATIMGAFDAVIDLAMGISPMIVIPLTSVTGNLDFSFLIASVPVTLALIAAIVVKVD